MIYYLTPFCPQKRLGHIHNDYCKIVPNDDDYICLLDPDVMFLHPHQQKWIEDIVLSEERQKYDILGCMTNRIGNEENLHPDGNPENNEPETGFLTSEDGMHHWFSKGKVGDNFAINSSIQEQMKVCNWMYGEYGNEIKSANISAGFLMIFRKSLWNKIKFQEGINFDIKFCEAVRASGGKIGIMKGIYVYHNYRMGKANIKDKTHLLNRPQ